MSAIDGLDHLHHNSSTAINGYEDKKWYNNNSIGYKSSSTMTRDSDTSDYLSLLSVKHEIINGNYNELVRGVMHLTYSV